MEAASGLQRCDRRKNSSFNSIRKKRPSVGRRRRPRCPKQKYPLDRVIAAFLRLLFISVRADGISCSQFSSFISKSLCFSHSGGRKVRFHFSDHSL